MKRPCCGCIKPINCKPIPFRCENDGRDVELIPLEDFLPRVTLIAKGVPDEVAIEYLRQSAMTLAKDSRLLKRTAYSDVQAGVTDYYIENGEQEQVTLIHDVAVGCPSGWQGMDTSFSNRGCFVALKECRNEHFIFQPPDKIVLRNVPKEDGEKSIKIDYFAVPTQNCCEVDKLLYDRYQDVVVNGALANLLFMRQYDFADPQMAMLYEKRFKQGITQAKIDVTRDFETGTQLLRSESWI